MVIPMASDKATRFISLIRQGFQTIAFLHPPPRLVFRLSRKITVVHQNHIRLFRLHRRNPVAPVRAVTPDNQGIYLGLCFYLTRWAVILEIFGASASFSSSAISRFDAP